MAKEGVYWQINALLISLISIASFTIVPSYSQQLENQGDAGASPSKEEIEGISLVPRFFSDWNATRRPLSEIKRSAINHRELTIDDILYRLVFDQQDIQDDAQAARSPAGADAALIDGLVSAAKIKAAIFRTEENRNLVLSAPKGDLVIGHPDCASDYQCMCQPEHTYNAIPADSVGHILPHRQFRNYAALMANISEIPKGVFHDCYQLSNHHEGFAEQTYCRFMSEIRNVRSIEGLRIIGDPKYYDGIVDRILFEASTRVTDQSKLPLHQGKLHQGQKRFIRPISAEIGGKEYYFEEIFSDPGVRCALIKQFEHPVIDLSACADRVACAAKAAQALEASFEDVLGDNPIVASLDLSSPPLPGERIFVRNYKPSKVLGSPYYESSQYLIRWYRNSIGNVSPPGLYTYSSGNPSHPGDYIFVRVHHSLSVRASERGAYPEGGREQYESYREALDVAMLAATEKACGLLGGTMSRPSICKIEH